MNEVMKSGFLIFLILGLALSSATIGATNEIAPEPGSFLQAVADGEAEPVILDGKAWTFRTPPPPENERRVRSDHPRLYLTSDNLPGMREKLSDPVYTELMQRIRSAATNNSPGVMLYSAFLYQITQDPAWAEKTKQLLLDYNTDTSIYGPKNKTVGTDGNAYKYEPVFAFDWIMDTLTHEEKVKIFGHLKANFNYDYKAVPIDEKNEWYWNDFWRKDLMFYPSLAFAIHEEGIDDAWADEVIASAYDEDDHRLVGPYGPNHGAGYLDVLMSLSLDSGGFSPIGSTYDTYWMTGFYAMAFWESATQEPIFDRTLLYQKYPETFFTTRNGLLVGRKFASRQMMLEYLTGIYQGETAALSKYLSDLYGRSAYALVYRAIFGDLRVLAKSPAEADLPTAKYNRGDHTFYSKDNWGDNAISLIVRSIYLDMARYTGNEGLFSIYKGDKPIAPRVYNSKNPPTAGLHSGIWIYDPTVIDVAEGIGIKDGAKKIKFQNVGAYWTSDKAYEALPTVTKAHFNVGGPKNLEITDKYRAISMESGYRYTYQGVAGHTVNTAQRTIVHIPDGDRNYILVYDYLDVDPALKSAWQMRLVDTPVVEGNQFSVPGVIKGTVVSPENHTLEWLGGADIEFVGPSPERMWYSKGRDHDEAGYSYREPNLIPSLGLGNLYVQPEGQRDSSIAPFVPQVEYLVVLEVSELERVLVEKISEREVSFDRWQVSFSKDGTFSILENGVSVNRPPVLEPIPAVVVNAGDSITLTPTASDENQDQLSFSFSGWMSGASYTTSTSDLGEHQVTVTVTDGTLTDSQTVSVFVKDPTANRAPTLNPIPDITVVEGDEVNISPSASDPDLNQLTYSYSGGWMTSSSRMTTHADVGTHRVIVTVSDGELYDTQELTVTVKAADSPNHAPVLDPLGYITVYAGEEVVITPSATDIDDDQLTFTYKGWMTSDRYTTTQADIGKHLVEVWVSDGELTDWKVARVVVLDNGAVDPPAITLQPVSQNVAEGSPVTLSVEATGAGLTYQWIKDGLSIAGAISPTYTINSVTVGDQGTYSVVVTNTQGASVTSDNAVISVNKPAYQSYAELCATQGGAGCRNFDSMNDILALNEIAVPGSPNRPSTNTKCRWNGGSVSCYPVFDQGSCADMDALGPRSQNSFDEAKRWSPCYDADENAARLTFWNDLYSGIQHLKAVGPAPQATDQVWTQYELKLSPEFFFSPQGSSPSTLYVLGRQKTDACKNNNFAQHNFFEISPDKVTIGPAVGCVSSATNGAETAFSVDKSRASHWLRVTSHYDIANSGVYFWVYDVTTGELLAQNYAGTYGGTPVDFLGSTVDITDLTFRNYSGAHQPNPAKPSPHYWVKKAVLSSEPINPEADISITAHPVSQSVEEGSSLTLSVEASGEGLTYQWTKDGLSIVGAVSSAYTLNAVTLDDQGTYSVVVTNTQGASVTSNGAVISVNKPAYQSYAELCATQGGAECRNFDSMNDILALNEIAVPGSPNRPSTNTKCRWNGGSVSCYPVFDQGSCADMDALGPRSQNSFDEAKRWSPCYDADENAARLTFWNDLYSGIQHLKAVGPAPQATDQVWTQYELKLSPEFFFSPQGSSPSTLYSLGRQKSDVCKNNNFAQHIITDMTPESVTIGPVVGCVTGSANGSAAAFSIDKSRANHWLRVTSHYDITNSGIYFWVYDVTTGELLAENYVGSYDGAAVDFMDSTVDITDLTFRTYSGSHTPNPADPSAHYWVRRATHTSVPISPN